MAVKTQQSATFRERMVRGAEIADKLPKLMGLQDAAKKLGVSETYVRRVECLALAKLEAKIRELCAQEGGEI